MKGRGLLVVGLLIFFILIIRTINAEYSSEILSKYELTKNIISDVEIKMKTQEIVNNIIKESSEKLRENSSNEFQEMIYNLYHNNIQDVGEPKLIFNEEKPIDYIVPLMKNGLIVSFIELDPYTGKVLDYPGWNGKGETYLKVNNDFWINLEKDIAEKANISFNNETRIISIRNSPFTSITYLVTPTIQEKNIQKMNIADNNLSEDRELKRVVVSSFLYETPILILNTTPEVYNEVQQTNINSVSKVSTQTYSLGSLPVNFYPDYMIPDYEKLPFKNQLTDENWVNYVNYNLHPVNDWHPPSYWWLANLMDPTMANPWKCLSYGASTVADWFSIRNNLSLGSYKSYTNGQIESGHNPRELEVMYHLKNAINPEFYIYSDNILNITLFGLGNKDPTTSERIPYNIKGYAEILKNPDPLSNFNDPVFLSPSNDFRYSVTPNEYLIKDYVEFPVTENNLKWALVNKGIIYVHLWPESSELASLLGIPIHAPVLVGYGETNGETEFIYHDSFGSDESPEYQLRTYDRVNEAIYFIPKEPVCYNNLGCGTSGYIGNKLCGQNNNTYQDYANYNCVNPGTIISECNYNTNLILRDVCNFGCENGVCSTKPPLSIKINQPSEKPYNYRRILLDVQTDKVVDEIRYINYNDRLPKEKILCKNCNSYTKLNTFNEGNQTIKFKAIKDNVVVAEKTVSFFVDTKKPVISKESPKSKSFVNISTLFSYEFKEDNPNISELYINNIKVLSKIPNSADKDNFNLSTILTSFNGQEIEYYFVLSDVANNIDISRKTKVTVDTTTPILNNLDSFWRKDGKYIDFYFDVTEKNFDEISFSYLDSRGRLKSGILCTRLKGGICEVKKLFSTGNYKLNISILDKAGNSAQKELNFTI